MRKGLKNLMEGESLADEELTEAVITISEDVATAPDGPQSETYEFLNKSIRLQPKVAEQKILSDLEKKAELIGQQLFGHADQAIERFYSRAKDGDRFDFTQLSGFELEDAILTIQRTVYIVTPEVAKLYNDAYLASRIQEDTYWEHYQKPVGGTKDDLRAFALRQSRDERYFYYFRYMLWRYLSERLVALKELLKTLEFFRSRALKDRGLF